MNSKGSTTILLEAQKLVKNYDQTGQTVKVLHEIDLSIEAGDMVGIVGQSGVGKTTLLYLLGAMEEPTSGTVLFEGKDIFALRDDKQLAEFRNKRIGYVFQFHHLIPEFSAVENVMMPAMLADLPKAKARKMAVDAMALLGVDHRLDHRPGELSGGEQQRVAVARSLVMRPQVIFADEPTGNLDADTADRLHDELMLLNQEHGISFVIVTHNEKLAGNMPRVIRLERGVAKQIKGGPLELNANEGSV